MRLTLPTAHRPTRLTVLGTVLVLGGLTGTAVAATTSAYAPVQRTNIDRAVPAGATLLPSGRLVSPAGVTSGQGDFPEGLAVSPDGVLAVTSEVGQGDGTAGGDFGGICVDGQQQHPCAASSRLGAKPTTSPDEELLVTNLVSGAQTVLRSPATRCDPAATSTTTLNCFELGVVFSPNGRHIYATGGGNDAVYDFAVDPTAHTVATAPARVLYLQLLANAAPGGSGAYQKPNPGTQAARTKGLAITPDGKTLVVTEEQAGVLDLVSTASFTFLSQTTFSGLNPTGANGSASYPYQVVVSPDGTKAYVTLQGEGLLATVPLVTNAVTGSLTAGPPVAVTVGDHPTGLALSPDGATLLVADANDDTVSTLPLTMGLPSTGTRLTVHAQTGEVIGSVPDAVAFAGDGTAYVALAGDDAVAQLTRTDTGPFTQTGLVPTGWYPTAVGVRPGTGELLAVSAKGLGSAYTPQGGYPAPTTGGPQALNPGGYDGANMPGLLQRIPVPTTASLAAGTATVQRNIDYAAAADTGSSAPAGPIPLSDATAGQSPIKHVVYIVRENRTYDQVFGDLATTRNDVDADPAYESLAPATPNAHAIVGRYASSDSFFSDGEASIQGHYWTTSANVDDYVEKSWRQYYSSRNHSSDSVATTVSGNRDCSIFQAAQAKAAITPGFTYKDYGDPVGFANPSVSATVVNGVGNPTGAPAAGTLTPACPALPAANADLTNFGNFLGLLDTDSATRFLTDNGLNGSGDIVPGTDTLKSLSYLELPLDHTTGFTPQGPTNINGLTPRAEVANNDAAVGQVISALSKSSAWSSTAVFVVEDDSQDGPDHVDGHRNILLVASPYARQTSANSCYTGYVGHVHNDQAGVLRTIELMLGLPSLSSYDAEAAPLYDLFQNKGSATQLTPADLAPYQPAAAPSFAAEKVGDASAGSSAQQQVLKAESAKLDLTRLDRAGPGLEDVLWRSTTNKPLPTQLRYEIAARSAATPSGAGAAADDASSRAFRAASAGTAQPKAAAGVDCSPTVASGAPVAALPEVRLAVALPLVASLAGLGVLLIGRRRRRGEQDLTA